MAELKTVVWHVDDDKLVANVLDGDMVRHVTTKWKSKTKGNIPTTWYPSVMGEVDFQRTEDKKKAEGRPTL